eukprot:jgi/Botrbrau1/6804/Bobra.0153s0007.1
MFSRSKGDRVMILVTLGVLALCPACTWAYAADAQNAPLPATPALPACPNCSPRPIHCLAGFELKCITNFPGCSCCWECVPKAPIASPPPPDSCPGADKCPRFPPPVFCKRGTTMQCVEKVAGCPCCYECAPAPSPPPLPPSPPPPKRCQSCPRPILPCKAGFIPECVDQGPGCECCYLCVAAPSPPPLPPSPPPRPAHCPTGDKCRKKPFPCENGNLECVEKVAGCPCCFECVAPSPPTLPPSPPPPPKSCPPRDKCLPRFIFCKSSFIRECVYQGPGCECCIQCVPKTCPSTDVCPRVNKLQCTSGFVAQCVDKVAGCPCCWECVAAPSPPPLPPSPPPGPKHCPTVDKCPNSPPFFCKTGTIAKCVDKVAGCPCCWECVVAPSPPPLPPSPPPPPESCPPRDTCGQLGIQCKDGFNRECVNPAGCPCCLQCVEAPSPPPESNTPPPSRLASPPPLRNPVASA